MRRYEKKTYIPRGYDALVEMTCDLCGKKTDLDGWAENDTDIEETKIEYKSGWSCRDGGDTETTYFDVCPDCFKGKVIPWFESHGATPTKHAIDF